MRSSQKTGGSWSRVLRATGPLLACAIAWLAAVDAGRAQPAPESQNPGEQQSDPVEPTEPALPRPAGPDTTLWIDDDGTPRPLVGMSYEELTRAWRKLQQLGEEDTAPLFTREALLVQGEIAGDRVSLTLRCEIRLESAKRTPTPLGFAGAILRGRPRISGTENEREFVAYDAALGGYVAWLRGAPGERRVVELQLLVPLEQEGVQTLLRANLPRANRSTLRLSSPNRIADVFVSRGALLKTLEGGRGETVLEIVGAVGEFQLGWRSAAEPPVDQRPVALRAVGQILCDIDEQTVRSQAKLVVQSYGGPLERFRVRLPVGAVWSPPPATNGAGLGPRITRLPDESLPDGSSRALCLVTLPKRTAEPVTVRLAAERTGLDGNEKVDLTGFEVVGAVRQHGEVALRVAGDRRLRWGKSRLVRRLEVASLPEPLRQAGVTAAAHYFGQPWNLSLSISPLPTRIQATPRYRLEIRPTEAVLRTTITYQIPGARVSGFSVDLHDYWLETPTPIQPVGVVDREKVTRSKSGELYIPLKKPASRWEEIEFTARRELPRDELVEMPLPLAGATSQGASELLVVVDPAVEWVPDLQRSRQLRQVALPEDRRDPADPTGLRTFLYRGFLPGQVLAAQKRLRPGEVDVAIETEVAVDDDTTSVRQRFDYNVRYQPINRVRLAAPAELVTANALRFELLGAAPNDTDESGAGGDRDNDAAAVALTYRPGAPPEADDSRLEVIVDLPRPWVGPLRLQAEFEVSAGARDLAFLDSIEAPLVSPLETPQMSHGAVVRSEGGARLDAAGRQDGWSPAGGASTGETFRVAADRVVDTLALIRRRVQSRASEAVVLRRSWRQTWIGDRETQQRAAFVFDSAGREVAVDLPDIVSAAEVEVLLDGEPVRGVRRSGKRLTAPLPVAGDRRHTLELRYLETPASRASVGWRPARLIANNTGAESYWELILPPGLRALGTPAGFARAMSRPTESLSGAQPLLDSSELEAWADAYKRGRPTAERRYLFSSYGPPPNDMPAAVPLVGYRLIVLSCSAAVLAVGLALIYLPWLRSGQAVFGLVVVGVGLGLAFPEILVTFAQAGRLGLAVVAVAAALALVLRRPEAPANAEPNSSLIGSPTGLGTDTFVALSMTGASSNAPTVSVPPDSSGV